MDDRRKNPEKDKEITYHVGWKKGTIRPNGPISSSGQRQGDKPVAVKSVSSFTVTKPAALKPADSATGLPTWTVSGTSRGRFVSILPNAAWCRAPWLPERLVMPLLWLVPAASFALTVITVYLLMHINL